MGYFGHFLVWGHFSHFFFVSGVFWSILVVFEHIWSFLSLGGILVNLNDFMSTLVIFKFYRHFDNFDYWVIEWVGVYP